MTLSLSGLTWVNGTTVISDQSAYNLGVQHIADWANAHATNSTVNGVTPDAHNTSHIIQAAGSISITQASANTQQGLDTFLAEITTRIHLIEGDAAVTWGAGVSPSSIKALNDEVAGIIGGTTAIGHATTADSLVAPTSIHTTISDYRVTPGPSGYVTVATGGGYVDTAGNFVLPDASTHNVQLPTPQPSIAGQYQFVWITKPPGTGNVATPRTTAGLVGATPAIPAYPTGDEPLALVTWRQSAPLGVVSAADITDIRYGHGGGGGSGGSGGVPASPEVVLGTSGTAIDALKILSGYYKTNADATTGTWVTPLKDIRVAPAVIAGSATGATFDDALNGVVFGDVDGALVFSGGTITVHPAPGKTIYIRAFGKEMRFDSTVSVATNTVSAQGAYYLCADLSGTGPIAAAVLVANPGSNQVALRKYYFDGSTIYSTAPHGPYDPTRPFVGGGNFQPWKKNTTPFTTAALAIAGGTTLISGVGVLTFDLPDANMRVEMNWFGKCTAPASPGDMRIYAVYSTGLSVPPFQNAPYIVKEIAQAASSTHSFNGYWGDMPPIGPGPLNVTLGYTCSVINYVLEDLVLKVEVSR